MTHRQRWNRTMHFQSVDHVPDEEFGYWTDTLQLWHGDGLPAEIRGNGEADRYFGFAPRGGVPIDHGLRPAFEDKVVSEDDTHRVVRDSSGVTSMVSKDGSSSIPKYLEFPIKTREDWRAFKERLNPHDPARFPTNWEALKAQYAQRDYPLGISIGSLFGWLRNWMGFEHCAMTCALDPAWIHEMVEHLCEFILVTIDRAVRELDLDFAAGWEDMAFNKGPMISPKMFAEFLVPRYKRITDLLGEHGVDVVIVDCDGNINDIAGLWIEGGVNCMFPVEVAAGTDPRVLRQRYGRQVLLLGGVNKRSLARGPEAIREEIASLEELVAMGGCIPHVDHRVPPDVSYDNYLFYLEHKRRTFGIPDPPGWPAVRAAREAAKR